MHLFDRFFTKSNPSIVVKYFENGADIPKYIRTMTDRSIKTNTLAKDIAKKNRYYFFFFETPKKFLGYTIVVRQGNKLSLRTLGLPDNTDIEKAFPVFQQQMKRILSSEHPNKEIDVKLS